MNMIYFFVVIIAIMGIFRNSILVDIDNKMGRILTLLEETHKGDK